MALTLIRHLIAKLQSQFSSVKNLNSSELLQFTNKFPLRMDYGTSYDEIASIVSYLQEKTSLKPTTAILTSSHLIPLVDKLTDKIIIPHAEIPNFPRSKVPGYLADFVFGKLANNVAIVLIRGRPHFYEGFSSAQCVIPVRVMKLLGVTYLIILNNVGTINPNYSVGDLMLILDHVNFVGFAGNNPLRGPNDERWGTRFPLMRKAYDRSVIDKAKRVFQIVGTGGHIFEGVYACVGGPNYETIAELNVLKTCGVDVVGMSSVHEVIAAVHCGIAVLGLSLVTNKCKLGYDTSNSVTHEEVVNVAEERTEALSEFIMKLIIMIAAHRDEDNDKKCDCND